MTQFEYTAEKSDGEKYKGISEAADRFALYEVVRREGGRIISFAEVGAAHKWDVDRIFAKFFGRVKEYDRILFARNLGAMLAAGLPLARALAVIERQTKNKKLVSVVGEVTSSVRKGSSLHEAFANVPHVFPQLFIAMVKAGEEGGDLSGSLTMIADSLERMYTIKKKIRGALIYPCIILVAIVAIGFLMMTKVVPTLAATFRDMHATLPLSTQAVIAISDFLVKNTALALGIIVFLAVGLYLAMKTKRARRVFDFLLLSTPIIGGIVRQVNAARTSRTLASLLASGVDVLTSLSITSEVVQNSYFRAVLAKASVGVAAGQPLSISFAENEKLYPAFVGEMMSVGEETGQTNEMLKRLALFYEDEVDRKTKDMSTIIEPFLMLLIGGAVGFFAVSMISPIYSLTSSI